MCVGSMTTKVLPLLMKQQWMRGNIAENNEGIRMELLRALKPSDSSRVARVSATLGSLFSILVKNKIKEERYGEEERQCWFHQRLNFPKL